MMAFGQGYMYHAQTKMKGSFVFRTLIFDAGWTSRKILGRSGDIADRCL